MVAIRLEGRLGNQLFQYAFIYTTAKKLNTTFYLDKSIETFLLPGYFEVKNDFLSGLDKRVFSINGYKNVFSIHLKKAFYSFLGFIMFRGHVLVNDEYSVKQVSDQPKNNCLYYGFFQSASYFHEFREEIRELFRVKTAHIAAWQQIQKRFSAQKKKAVIHIRRSDYVGMDISLPARYYKKAIEIIGTDNIEYIFISDDPAFVGTEFGYIPGKFVSTYDEITDLQFLINADICILSNSSFSWWGAWLNNNQNKRVFVPEYWLGFKEGKEYPAGIFENIIVEQIKV